jgi:hypothetical protein
MNNITPQDINAMVAHWLSVPAGSYLGSDYGNGLNDLLQLPISVIGLEADKQLAKLLLDVPILAALPEGSINIYRVPTPNATDSATIAVEVLGQIITANGVIA